MPYTNPLQQLAAFPYINTFVVKDEEDEEIFVNPEEIILTPNQIVQGRVWNMIVGPYVRLYHEVENYLGKRHGLHGNGVNGLLKDDVVKTVVYHSLSEAIKEDFNNCPLSSQHRKVFFGHIRVMDSSGDVLASDKLYIPVLARDSDLRTGPHPELYGTFLRSGTML